MLKHSTNTRVTKHYKMYKASKKWLFAGIIGLTIAGSAQGLANAISVPILPQGISASADDDGSRPYWFAQNTDYFKHYNETPDKSSVPKSTQETWGPVKTGNELDRIQKETSFTYEGLTYNKEKNTFTMKFTFNSPTLTTSGAGRTTSFDLAFSKSMSEKTSNVMFTDANHNTQQLTAKNNVFNSSYPAGTVVGGTSTLTVDIQPVKIVQDDQVTGMFSSDTQTINNHAIYGSARTLGFPQFGNAFNNALIDQLKKNTNENIDNKQHLTPDQKKDFHDKVNGEDTNKDFVNDLNGINNDANNADNVAAKAGQAKDAAKAAIDNAANNAKKKIDGLDIPQTDKDKAKSKVDADAKNAKDDIARMSIS
ncbi:hypothetical protein G6R29_06405 [Fructobacillus sp. M2-14]|uniref:Uncharacterized protein n=1 Tax=Fructobacillus broussonetiae TaxID=2713173 RepID=A0ABS5R1B6_9LACO|nr:KxYKxGKxW signal peptide domain-containing protein [Fructobacillus broussonetiae]MBS9339235.1 hypothetical protein [Fructobacillus broussonetiae]